MVAGFVVYGPACKAISIANSDTKSKRAFVVDALRFFKGEFL